MDTENIDFKFRGTRALVMIHEQHLSEFLTTWKKAYDLKIKLPETNDPDYESLDHVLLHVLRSCGRYLTWICKNLDLPDPAVMAPPDVRDILEKSEVYYQHLKDRWSRCLLSIEEPQMDLVFKSNWGVDFPIEGMLEHAAMHPVRHNFQLKELIAAQ